MNRRLIEEAFGIENEREFRQFVEQLKHKYPKLEDCKYKAGYTMIDYLAEATGKDKDYIANKLITAKYKKDLINALCYKAVRGYYNYHAWDFEYKPDDLERELGTRLRKRIFKERLPLLFEEIAWGFVYAATVILLFPTTWQAFGTVTTFMLYFWLYPFKRNPYWAIPWYGGATYIVDFLFRNGLQTVWSIGLTFAGIILVTQILGLPKIGFGHAMDGLPIAYKNYLEKEGGD